MAGSRRFWARNGAGKTTTLKAISNLLHSERGEVTKGSVEISKATEVQDISTRPKLVQESVLHPGDGGAALLRAT